MCCADVCGYGSGSDPASILGGVRLPPDTEIIKYTSSIVGPKIPGTTNRGRKKTISLDPPSVSVLPTSLAHHPHGSVVTTAGLLLSDHHRRRAPRPPRQVCGNVMPTPMVFDSPHVIAGFIRTWPRRVSYG
jgi:hypothetical protein